MEQGWFSLYRKIIKSPVFDNPFVLKVWIWCLSKATHEGYKQVIGSQVVELEAGQFVFGRKVAAVELDMSESMVYRHVKMLETMGNLTIKSNNKFSVITIVNWGIYQGNSRFVEQQMNNKRTTNEQQMNTNNNINNKNNKIYKASPNKFKNFEQRTYDYSDLEQRLLGK